MANTIGGFLLRLRELAKVGLQHEYNSTWLWIGYRLSKGFKDPKVSFFTFKNPSFLGFQTVVSLERNDLRLPDWVGMMGMTWRFTMIPKSGIYH